MSCQFTVPPDAKARIAMLHRVQTSSPRQSPPMDGGNDQTSNEHATNKRFKSQMKRSKRSGNITVISVFAMVLMCVMTAFAFDIGHLLSVRTELQRSADAAALASCWELVDEAALRGDRSMNEAIADTRKIAIEYAALNIVGNKAPGIDGNVENSIDGDVVIGHLPITSSSNDPLSFDDPGTFNAVQVRVRRTSDRNGMVPLFFARMFGSDSVALDATATAALSKNIGGFRIPQNCRKNVPILPFALDEETWNRCLAGDTGDAWTWNATDQEIESGADGIHEFNLFPQDTGSPGNRGTVNIGTSNNSTSFLSGQILDGISVEDLNYHGGELNFNEDGVLHLGGNPGISAAVKDELTEIAGQPRMIPIFREVHKNGDNAIYTIVKFVGVRILEVELTGGEKRVIVQPANVVTRCGIPSDLTGTSDFVYLPSHLIR